VNGFEFKLPQIVLAMEIATNIVRNIVLPLEPTGIQRGIFPMGPQTWLFSCHFPYAFITNILIAVYWHQLVSRTKGGLSKKDISLNQWKIAIPFGIICLILIAIDHTSSAIRSTLVSQSFVITISGILFVISLLGVGLFFLISGIRVLRYLKSSIVSQGSSKKLTSRMTTLITLCGIGLLTCDLFVVLLLFVQPADAFWIFCCWMTYMWYGIASLAQIMIFIPPVSTDESTKSDSGKTSTSKKTNTSGSGERTEEMELSNQESEVPNQELELSATDNINVDSNL